MTISNLKNLDLSTLDIDELNEIFEDIKREKQKRDVSKVQNIIQVINDGLTELQEMNIPFIVCDDYDDYKSIDTNVVLDTNFTFFNENCNEEQAPLVVRLVSDIAK